MCDDRAGEAADVLASVGAVSREADVRLHAAGRLASRDPAAAEQQLDRAVAFWRTVGATARLATAERLRIELRATAS